MSMSSEIAGAIEEADDLLFDRKQSIEDKSIIPTLSTRQNDITISQRMTSACAGSLLTSLVVTPFDVVKIRLQQQQLLFPKDLKTGTECCRKVFWEEPAPKESLLASTKKSNAINTSKQLTAHTLKKVSTLTSPAGKMDEFCVSHSCVQETKINGTFSGLSKIASQEGIITLYRGLSLTLLMAVPSNMVYFTGYEYLRDSSPLRKDYPVLNPLLSGSFARICAATVVSPIELIKTRLQAVPSTAKNKSSEIMKMVVSNSYNEIKTKGILSIFKGLQLTLWRDVPFSGCYWASYEYITYNLKKLSYFQTAENSQLDKLSAVNDGQLNTKIFLRSFISGSLSGIVGAIVTNPFDVGKTRMQVGLEEPAVGDNIKKSIKKESMFRYMYTIYKADGFASLYVGLAPRCLKIAPSCAIMISTYELSKSFFSRI